MSSKSEALQTLVPTISSKSPRKLSADEPCDVGEYARHACMGYVTSFFQDAPCGLPLIDAPYDSSGVLGALTFLVNHGENTPEEIHSRWMEAVQRLGWISGKTYCPYNKTHPMMVPYGQIEENVRKLYSVFIHAVEDVVKEV